VNSVANHPILALTAVLICLTNLASCGHSPQPQRQETTIKTLYLNCEQKSGCTVISFEKSLPSDQITISMTVYKTTGMTYVPIRTFEIDKNGVPQRIIVPSTNIGEADKHYVFLFAKERGKLNLVWDTSGNDIFCCFERMPRWSFHEVTGAQASQEITQALGASVHIKP